MIPIIRSLSELSAITESKGSRKNFSHISETHCPSIDSGQMQRNIKSCKSNEVYLPNLPKKLRRKWISNKVALSKFFDDLDYNNQIQSSYDLVLIERQRQSSQRDVA